MRASTDWTRGLGHPYLDGLFAPVEREIDAADLPVIGELPRDLDGVFLRNGPNPVHPPRGRYHWFDGDGMVHAVEFRDGRASYRNRWVRTAGLAAERSAGRALWPGYLERPDLAAPPGEGSDGWLKDSANTDLVFHRGAALALWYQCGVPYRLDPKSLADLGPETFGGALPRRVSAHAKVDEATGELFFFDYATREPYLAVHAVDRDGVLAHSIPVELPGPRLPHDMAITERFVLVMDLPLFWDEALLARGIHKLVYREDLPSRFGLLPRRGRPEDVRWFEAEPTYIYHVVNAWEEDGAVVMDACRTLDPLAARAAGAGPLARMLAVLKQEARLARWRFDLRTGRVDEQSLDDRNAEFPSIDARRLGRKTRRACLARIARDEPTLLFDALIQYDTASGGSDTWECGPGRFASEAAFAPRAGGVEEDDGYLVSFVADAKSGRSEVVVLDARAVGRGPVARVLLPQRVPVGFHACFVRGDQLPP